MKKYNEIYSRPIAMNMAEENEKIWMALLNRNGICMIDKKTRRAQICKIFENESFEKEFLYYCVEKVGKYLVFSPCEAEKIAIFDLENDTIIYIPLKKIQCVCKENPNISKFCNILKYQSDVYLLGYSYPAIVKINLESLEVTYITNWVEEVENSIEIGDSSGYFSDGYVIKNDSALIPIGCMGAILELDLKNSNTKIRKLNIPMKGIGGISSVDGENIWLVGRVSKTNRVVCWNRQTDNIKEYYLNDLDDDVFAPFHVPFCTIFKVFLMPILSPCIYEINIDTGEIKKNEISDKLFKEGDSSLWLNWKVMAPRLQDNWLKFLTCSDLKWHEYNVETGEYRNFFIHLDEEISKQEYFFNYIYCEMDKKNAIIPEIKIPLDYFIWKISKKRESNLYESKDKFLIGNKIYELIRIYGGESK